MVQRFDERFAADSFTLITGNVRDPAIRVIHPECVIFLVFGKEIRLLHLLDCLSLYQFVTDQRYRLDQHGLVFPHIHLG